MLWSYKIAHANHYLVFFNAKFILWKDFGGIKSYGKVKEVTKFRRGAWHYLVEDRHCLLLSLRTFQAFVLGSFCSQN